MGNFSVIVPIYLGAIFVFFIYIVAKIMMKKFDDKEEEEEVDPKDAYKDDGWWSKITERINKVGECVKKGTDLEIDEEDEKKANNTKKSENSGEFDVLKHRLDRTEESLNNLGKNIQYYPISLQQHFLMFFSSNLDETGFQRTVSEIADQEDSKTPPGNLIWSEIE